MKNNFDDQETGQPRLLLQSVTKEFPGCLANDSVDLRIEPGEIHALLGENGAGKSTLVKMIYGILKPDSGTMIWEGNKVQVANPAHARDLGIGMVFQHFSLFEALTVKENIALGMTNPPAMDQLEQQILEVETRYGLPLDPNRAVHSLSVGEKQRIEIVRCLLQDPSLLIMDEPTSVLTPQEAETLFVPLRQLSEEGCSILYISHKLDEVRQLCQSATILRHGCNVGDCIPANETPASMAALMIGEEFEVAQRGEHPEAGPVTLEIRSLSRKSEQSFGIDLHDINLEVHSGELMGIAGVAGNGQAELLELLSGEVLSAADEILIGGEPIGHRGSTKRRQQGLCFVPEERLGHGSVPDMSLNDNSLLSGFVSQPFLNKGFIATETVRKFTRQVIDLFDVRCPGQDALAGSLSGGNLQKFIVGREILQQPKVLVVAQPTWGVDAGAAALIHRALLQLAAEGAAVLVVSQDLDELLTISHRIAAICGGSMSESYDINEVSAEDVGLLMTGVSLDKSSTKPGPAQGALQ